MLEPCLKWKQPLNKTSWFPWSVSTDRYKVHLLCAARVLWRCRSVWDRFGGKIKTGIQGSGSAWMEGLSADFNLSQYKNNNQKIGQNDVKVIFLNILFLLNCVFVVVLCFSSFEIFKLFDLKASWSSWYFYEYKYIKKYSNTQQHKVRMCCPAGLVSQPLHFYLLIYYSCVSACCYNSILRGPKSVSPLTF